MARRVELEAADAVRLGRILDADHVETPAVREGIDVLVVDVHVVDAATQLIVEPGQDAHADLGLGNVEDNEAVLAVRGALTADHRDAAVLGNLDVVDGTGVHADRVDEHDALRIGHVPDVGVALGAPGARDRVVVAVGAFPDPEIGCAAVADLALADELDLLVHLARRDPDRQAGGVIARESGHRVDARPFGHEGAVLLDLGRGAGRQNPRRRCAREQEADGQVLDRVAVPVEADRLEPDHVARARAVGGCGHFQPFGGIPDDGDLDLVGGVLGGRRKSRPPGRHQAQASETVGRRDAGVGTRVADFDVIAFDCGDVDDAGLKGQVRTGVEGAGQVDDLDALDRRVRDRHLDFDPEQGFRPAGFVFGLLRHQGDDGDRPWTVRFNLAGRVDPEPPAVAGVEDDIDAFDRLAVLVHDGRGQVRLVADLQGQLGGRHLEFGAGRHRRLFLVPGAVLLGVVGLFDGLCVRLLIDGFLGDHR